MLNQPTVEARWRLPAEWEPQDATLLAWPYEGSDWTPVLRYAQQTYRELIAAIRRYQPVVLCIRGEDLLTEDCWSDPGGKHPVIVVPTEYDDTWLRDTAPLTLFDDLGQPAWANFVFDGWGGRSHHPLDASLASRLWAEPQFNKLPFQNYPYVMEGGAIDSDGMGTVMTTTRCWRSRDTDFSKRRIAANLGLHLGAERVLWLDHGELLGDDTDSHIDMLARFAPDNTIIYQGCQLPSDPHYPFMQSMRAQLETFRTLSGKPYRLLELPMPSPVGTGRYRCPATYANFLVLNNAVLMPTYGDEEHDQQASRVISTAFPGFEVVGIDCRVLITQGGAVHCATMNLPLGALRH